MLPAADPLDALVECAVNFADLGAGRNNLRSLRTSKMPLALGASIAVSPKSKAPRWTPQEDDYLRKNLGWLTEQEMGAALGRTPAAVRLRWKRDLRLLFPSKHPEYLSGQSAGRLLGLDEHKIIFWCDTGLIPSRLMAGPRKFRLIRKSALDLFVINPENWVYFDWRKLRDPRLRRLCELRSARWGDEWWTTRQVAEYHGVDPSDVKRLILRGEIPGYQPRISRSGRHKDRQWANWYVLRSDAMQAQFAKGRGSGNTWVPSQRTKEFLLRARQSGWTYSKITNALRGPCRQTVIKVISELVAEKS